MHKWLLCLLLSGCAFGQAVKKCELTSLPSSSQALIADVILIGSQPANYVQDLEKLAASVGVQQLDCVVTALIAQFAPYVKGADPLIEHLQEYLNTHAKTSKACK